MKTCRALLPLYFSLLARTGPACCAVSGPGASVQFAGQTNIVVWDPKRKMEHFIRNAQFSSAHSKVGFFAPTPSVPEIGEASVEAFDNLNSYAPAMGCSAREPLLKTLESSLPAGGVTVIQEVKAAGHRLTTVKADDSAALAEWMKSNGFVSNPAVQEWTEFYIKKKWYLTLFKVINDKIGLTTGTIRLSFKTDAPFNPYLVPKVNFAQNGRSALRLYVVSPEQLEPTLLRKVYLEPRWRAEISREGMRTREARLGLPDRSTFAGGHIAFYEDDTFPNAAPDDLYFQPRSVPLIEKVGKVMNAQTLFWGCIFLVGFGFIRLYRRMNGSNRSTTEPA